jgi:adenylate kinase
VRVVLMGPPGAGKGTQAAALAERLRGLHLSTGDLLRDHVRRGTSLGLQAKAIMERGDYVPDPLVLAMVEQRLAEAFPAPGKAAFVLDGFPRTVVQAQALDAMLQRRREPLDAVLLLEVAEGELLRRLAGRLTCVACGRAAPADSGQREGGACTTCGGALEVRDDDRPDTVRRRLDVYRAQTSPVVQFYSASGRLRHVDGTGGVAEVASRLDRVLGLVPTEGEP